MKLETPKTVFFPILPFNSITMLPASLTPEEKLLIALCRLEFNKDQVEQIRELASYVKDWDHFTELSNDHGIIALCKENIRKTGIENLVPQKNLEMLQQGFLKSLARNSFISGAVEELGAIAKKEDIKIVLLKGAALEITIYGNKGLRQMHDIDILVKPEDALRLRSTLISYGYTAAPIISKIYEKYLFVEGKHLPELTKKGMSVEIHFKLFDQEGNSLTENFYESSIQLPDCNNIFIPDPLLHFLYLVKHLAKHERDDSSQLRLYSDLLNMIEKNGNLILNRKLHDYATQAGIEEILAEKLAMIRELWGTCKALSDESSDYDINPAMITGIIRHPGELRDDSYRTFNSLKKVHGIRNKVLFLTGYAFPSPGYLRYHQAGTERKNIVLCYLYYWIKIIKEKIRLK